ncbi:DapH/DapD/GlmU-related protein [Anaerotruncus colihominis]|uniref:DapH/DapD/GlmU-related protein n=1 Tax=Anaerotruncus colihominis TaxID=169435 RepID=UPI0018977C49|nr:DapH/DapD/GlmU-related protein [Anaerotruncus colihominis]
MELKEYLELLNRGETIEPGSEAYHYMHAVTRETMQITARLNTGYHTAQEIRQLFSQIIGKAVDDTFILYPPFYTNCGKNITVGKKVFINMGCTFQDQGGITIGDGVLIGHNAMLATINHDEDPRRRAAMHPAPIVIGKNVWLGANVTVVPGVTIGDGAVVAAGAVVTRDIPAQTVAGGVPARFIRKIRSSAAD